MLSSRPRALLRATLLATSGVLLACSVLVPVAARADDEPGATDPGTPVVDDPTPTPEVAPTPDPALDSSPTPTPTPAPTAGPDPAYLPPSGPLFSDPLVDGPEGRSARRIIDALDDMIDNSPGGSVIRIASLRLNVPEIVTALRDAHRRGVVIRIVLPEDVRDDPATRQVATELNEHRLGPTDTSYVKFCHLACYADRAFSTAHAKLYLFSSTGAARNVTMTASSNISKSGYRTAFNDAYVTIGDGALYAASRAYVDGMKADRTPRRNPYHAVTTRTVTLQFFPDTVSSATRDHVSSIVNDTRCVAAAGTGDGHGHTVVRVIQPEWSANRTYVLDRLAALRRKGCVVQVLITRGGMSDATLRRFVRSGLAVRYTDTFVGDYRMSYAHSKLFAISGGFGGSRAARTVFTGSTNMTLTATRVSDNTIVWIHDSPQQFNRYAAYFDRIWGLSARLTVHSKSLTPGQRRASVGLG